MARLFDDVHNPRLSDLAGVAISEPSAWEAAFEPSIDIDEENCALALDRLGDRMFEHGESCSFGLVGCTGDVDGGHEDRCPAWIDAKPIEDHVARYMAEFHKYVATHAEWVG